MRVRVGGWGLGFRVRVRVKDGEARREELDILTLTRHGRVLEEDLVRRRTFGLLRRLVRDGLGLGNRLGLRLTFGPRVIWLGLGLRLRLRLPPSSSPNPSP